MLRIVPANQAACDDLQVVFGDRGTGHVCQCQRYKLSPGESFGVVPREERMLRLWDQTDCGNPGSDRTTGLVGYLGDQPVAWCAVEPRSDYERSAPGLQRSRGRGGTKTGPTRPCGPSPASSREPPTAGGLQQRDDVGRRRVRSQPWSSGGGACDHREDVIPEELHVGTPDTFAAAGLVEVSRPTKRRIVMRREFG